MTNHLDKSVNCCYLENISDGFILLDQHNRIKFANATARALLNSNTDCNEKVLWDELPNEIIQLFRRKMKTAQKSVRESHFETYLGTPSRKWIDVNIIPNSQGLTIQFRDITSQKEVEHKIQENQNKLLLLTEAANHIIFNEEPKEILDSLFHELSNYLDFDVYFNYVVDKEKQLIRLMNYSGIDEETAKKIEWLQFGNAVCGSVAESKEKIIMEQIEDSFDPRVSLIKGFGIKAYVCHPLHSYGRFIGTLSFGSSKRSNFTPVELELVETISNQVAMALERTFLITELKIKNAELSQNYEKLLKSEKKFKDIFNSVLDGIVLINTEGVILDANPSACRNLGLNYKNYIFKHYDQFLDILRLEKANQETTIRLRNGMEKTFEYSIAKDHGNAGTKLIIFRDITAKKKFITGLIEAKDLAEKTSKSKSEFLSMMSHELRTPLNSIVGYSQIMLDDEKNDLNDIQRERNAKILKSGRHLINLINEILDHVNIKSGKLNTTLEEINLSDVIEEAIRLIQPAAEAKEVIIRLVNETDIYVNGDPTRLKQVLINLLSNAVKYNFQKGKIMIRYKVLKKHVKIFIEDTGIGIAKDQLKQIFEPFYRIYHPELNIEGTGIGLTLVKNFVAMMGGTVGVESEQRKGSSFWFTLPLP